MYLLDINNYRYRYLLIIYSKYGSHTDMWISTDIYYIFCSMWVVTTG